MQTLASPQIMLMMFETFLFLGLSEFLFPTERNFQGPLASNAMTSIILIPVTSLP